jgi:PAS domain S-box-containing protein
MPALLDVLDKTGVGIVMFRYRAGTFEKLYGNAAAMTRVGYTPDEWLHAPLWELIVPDKRDLVEELLRRLVDGPLPSAIEFRLQHRDGHVIPSEFTVTRADIDGDTVLVFIDRTTQPHAQLSLLEADRVALVGALTAGFAHEINNPLTSVLLNLRSLRKQLASGLTDALLGLRCVDDVTLAAERIASNVRALQSLATRGTGDQVDVAAVVTSALRLATPTLEHRALVVRRIGSGLRVAGEESRLGQAVLAMLLFSSSGFLESDTNSPNNEIGVVVEARGERVVVEVSDNGRELAPEEVEHAFEPFFRSSTRGAAVGVGLGIARSVASTLGGDVSLGRRERGGAVITMTLPLAPHA